MAKVGPRKMIVDRMKSSTALQAARVHLDIAADEIATMFPGLARGTVRAAVLLIGGLFLDWLKRATDEMAKAGSSASREGGDNHVLLAQRKATVAVLRAGLVDMRGILKLFFGDMILDSFGFDGPVPEDPVVLHRTGMAALAQLRDFVPPPARRKSMRFVNSEWIELLEQPVSELGQVLREIAKDRRQDQLVSAEVNRAIAAYDVAFQATANLLVGLFIAAGRKDLADHVRPSTRRPGRTAKAAPSVPGGKGRKQDKKVA